MTLKIKSLFFVIFLIHGLVKAQNKVIKIDGSSTVFPISEALAEEFQVKNKNLKVIVGVSGTGGGFKKFCRGEIDLTGASRPITSSELTQCQKENIKFIELPIAFDATVVIVHPQNPINEISIAELKMIWQPSSQNKILKWNQVNPKWPSTALKLYGAGSDSGTFDYFTEAIVGHAKSSRGDYTASEDDNILIKGVAQDKSSLGYVPLSYYLENKSKVKALAVINKKSKAILPSEVSVKDASYNPLSRPLFMYVNVKAVDREEIKNFVNFMLDNSSSLVSEVKYVSLPDSAYSKAKDIFEKKRLGSVFKGHSGVGLSIEEVLKLESSL